MLDPAAEGTFEAARLDRALRLKGDHRDRWALYRALIALRRASPVLQRTARNAARAFATGGVLTLVRSRRDASVVAHFNVTAEPAEGILPDPPTGWVGGVAGGAGAGAGPGTGSPGWSRLLHSDAPQFGGPGETSPQQSPPGGVVRLAPWGFCVYHLTPAVGAA
jgi:hypothetical protein